MYLSPLGVILKALLFYLIRPVGILQNVTDEPNCLSLAGLELIAGERLGHVGRVPRIDRD